MMTVQPATAAAPGFFFGGWFTYDAGASNDPTSQHWLTLSGEIPVNATSGAVPVTIYRTLGGQLAAPFGVGFADGGRGGVGGRVVSGGRRVGGDAGVRVAVGVGLQLGPATGGRLARAADEQRRADQGG